MTVNKGVVSGEDFQTGFIGLGNKQITCDPSKIRTYATANEYIKDCE